MLLQVPHDELALDVRLHNFIALECQRRDRRHQVLLAGPSRCYLPREYECEYTNANAWRAPRPGVLASDTYFGRNFDAVLQCVVVHGEMVQHAVCIAEDEVFSYRRRHHRIQRCAQKAQSLIVRGQNKSSRSRSRGRGRGPPLTLIFVQRFPPRLGIVYRRPFLRNERERVRTTMYAYTSYVRLIRVHIKICIIINIGRCTYVRIRALLHVIMREPRAATQSSILIHLFRIS